MMNKPLLRPIDEEKGRELTRDWVDRKKAAAFVAAYAPNYTNLRREQEEVHAGLAAGTVTMQSLMED